MTPPSVILKRCPRRTRERRRHSRGHALLTTATRSGRPGDRSRPFIVRRERRTKAGVSYSRRYGGVRYDGDGSPFVYAEDLVCERPLTELVVHGSPYLLMLLFLFLIYLALAAGTADTKHRTGVPPETKERLCRPSLFAGASLGIVVPGALVCRLCSIRVTPLAESLFRQQTPGMIKRKTETKRKAGNTARTKDELCDGSVSTRMLGWAPSSA